MFKKVQRRASGTPDEPKRTHRRKLSVTYNFRRNSAEKVTWEMMPMSPEAGSEAPIFHISCLSPTSVPTPSEAGNAAKPLPSPPAYSPMRLPFELWALVFKYLQDGYDIYALAYVCRGILDVAQDAIEQHAALVRMHGTVTLNSFDPIRHFIRNMSASRSMRFAIRTLTIRCTASRDFQVAANFAIALRELPNVRTLAIYIQNEGMVQACLRVGLLRAPLLRLKAFSTSMSWWADVMAFLASHPALRDLAITSDAPTGSGSGATSPRSHGATVLPWCAPPEEPSPPPSSGRVRLPALRALSCTPRALELFRWPSSTHSSHALTHLHVHAYAPGTLARVAALLGAQLVSLRLGALERLPDLAGSPRAAWGPQDVRAQFPRLRYVQMHMFEPDFVPLPIQWQQKGRLGYGAARADMPSLTVAWVLEEEAWGTLVDPGDPDQMRVLFEEVAFDVLRRWTPWIDRVVYGDMGVPDTMVRLNTTGNGVSPVEGEVLGEDYWKRV